MYNTYSHYNELTTANLTLIPASIILGVGVFMFILGILVCLAACKENKILLAVVSYFCSQVHVHLCTCICYCSYSYFTRCFVFNI